VGDEVLLRQGEVATLESVSLDEVEEQVYNFHVAELQNYAVGVCGVLVHNTNDPSLGRGSTGRTVPANLAEQLAMEEAMSNPGAGRALQNITMNDARWPTADGWVKMRQNINGVEIHYVRNTRTGAVDDFKFK
jgi:hypothetical protein